MNSKLGAGPFHHVASLNLFRESYGHEVTVMGADPDVCLETPDGLKPIDHIENQVIAAALRMRDRKLADGTYRDEHPTQAGLTTRGETHHG